MGELDGEQSCVINRKITGIMTNKATQFKAGQSGNPKGRPPASWSWAGLLKEFGDQEINGKTKKEWIAESLIKEALKGNIPAIKEFGDRVEGKAIQKSEVTGKDGEPLMSNITIEFISPNPNVTTD